MKPKNGNQHYEISFIEAEQALKSYGLYLNSTKSVKNIVAKNIVADTRKLARDFIFVAYQGITLDLHDFVGDAVKAGCAFVVCEKPIEEKTPHIQVKNARAAWAVLAAEGWRIKARGLKFVGITGTNGKSSVCHTTSEILSQQGLRVLSLGTLGARIGNHLMTTQHTTPDPDEFYKIIAQSHNEHKIEVVVMEVSSHALTLQKVLPLKFDVCIFTSFSRDHLDFHESMEEYLDAKLSLFSNHTHESSRSVIYQELINSMPPKHLKDAATWSYGFKSSPSLSNHLLVKTQSMQIDHSDICVTFNNQTQEFKTPYIGETGILNFCASLLAAQYFLPALELSKINSAKLTSVPGRLEYVGTPGKEPLHILVDYCHTPDALEKCIQNIKKIADKKSKLWTIFGCGGDRDRGKRRIMGHIAFEQSDFTVITSDNPRTENPKTIIQEICEDLDQNSPSLFIEENRQKAIEFAVRKAQKGDTILIAGKGHEDYQIIGTRRLYFDDRIEAQKALRSREKQCS